MRRRASRARARSPSVAGGADLPVLRLDRQWNGLPAPAGIGGAARLELAGPDVVLAWDVALSEPARIPASPAGFLDGLWEHDVVEIFLAPATLPPGPPRYLEFEAGAGGHWLALSFADIRLRHGDLRDCDVRVRGAVSHPRWTGQLRVPVTTITGVIGPPPWRGLVAAVLGGTDHPRTYLTSSALPGEQPDFHQPARWGTLT